MYMSVGTKCRCRLRMSDARHLMMERIKDYVRPKRNLLLRDIRGYMQVLQLAMPARGVHVEELIDGSEPCPVLVYNGAGRTEFINLNAIDVSFDRLGAEFFMYPSENGVVKMQPLQLMNENHLNLQSEYIAWESSYCDDCNVIEFHSEIPEGYRLAE